MIAYLSMYGFWLPNDPRGSGSDYVAVWELFRYGQATKTDSRRSVAAAAHDAALRRAAKEVLRFPPVELSGTQAVAVMQGFAKACEEGNYRVHAAPCCRTMFNWSSDRIPETSSRSLVT